MKRIFFVILIFSFIFLNISYIQARPGGGQSFDYSSDDDSDDDYSSSSDDDYDDSSYDDDYDYSSDDSDFSYDDDDYVDYGDSASDKIFWILIQISIVSFVIFYAFVEFSKKLKRRKYRVYSSKNTTNISNASKKTNVSVPKIEKPKKIFLHRDNIYNYDPNFSKIFFSDFINLLVVRYFSSFGTDKIAEIEPFIGEKVKLMAVDFVKQNNFATTNARITEVVVGAVNLGYIQIIDNELQFDVDLEINFTLTNADVKIRHSLSETWYFVRDKNVHTKPPQNGVYELACPNCGASLNFSDQRICASCGVEIKQGKYDWYATKRVTKQHQILSQKNLFYYAQEQGTDKKAIIQPDLSKKLQQYATSYNIENVNNFIVNFKNNVVNTVFFEMYNAWATLQWGKVRYLLSDRLWESNKFWIDTYKHYGVVNKLDDLKIEFSKYAKIETDKFFETITIRIYAACKDYVEEQKTGKLIAGQKNKVRRFSEYWTFVRRKGVDKNIDKIDLNICPNCGAPADKMGQSAVCEYCKTKISTGEFGWILVSIEQDEVYRA